MKRWAIAKMGDWNNEGVNDPKFAFYGVNYRIWTRPGFGWCFGQIGTNNIAQMDGDNDIYILPDGVMDITVGQIPTATRNTMKTKLESAGFTFTNVKTSWTIRQLLNYLVNQVQTNINVEAGDVLDQEG